MEHFKQEGDREFSPSDKKTTSKSDKIITKKLKPVPFKRIPSKKNQKKTELVDGMPIRPLSAYNLFFRDERTRMLKARQEGNAGEIGSARAAELFSVMGKTIAKRWKELSAEERSVYTEVADKDSERYQREKEQYQLKLAKLEKDKTTEKKNEAAITAFKPTMETTNAGAISLDAGISDHSQRSEVAALPFNGSSDLARLQNLVQLRAALIVQEQSRINDIMRAEQIQSLLGRDNLPLGGLGQRYQLPSISSLASQELHLASLSNSRGPVSLGSNIPTTQNARWNIHEPAMQQERLNAYYTEQYRNSQFSLATQQQMIQTSSQLDAAATNNSCVSTPLISQFLLEQDQDNDDLPPTDSSSDAGRFH